MRFNNLSGVEYDNILFDETCSMLSQGYAVGSTLVNKTDLNLLHLLNAFDVEFRFHHKVYMYDIELQVILSFLAIPSFLSFCYPLAQTA